MERRIDDPSLTETVAKSVLPVSSSSSADEGRFIAGTLLGGRYRIIGLLGRGGMGEVYRATDLTLGQSVALKFLPPEAAGNNRLLERFAGEVRVARQVSHANVCRVYDLGEVDGAPFISMEYVDGEDLASLLPRIGRLPADKAIETARKICAGLAAAHDRGIIHRDLKPQNIMMNKRGEVVIMDFGLAAIADQLSGAEARNGTPAYMAPEQLKGSEVTTRSDIFALGLVLYELFTGKRPYDAKTVPQLLSQQEAGQLAGMTSQFADIDPAVEKVIRRCLDPDPLKRPLSALAVAAALPGGDPLAAALAAGETPSPELVAAAGKTEGMPLRHSIPYFLVVLAAVCATPFIRQHQMALMHGSLDYPPEVLAQKSRDIAVAMGYGKKPADTDLELEHRFDLVAFLKSKPEPRKWDEWLAAEAPIMANYRESPWPLLAPPLGYVNAVNPAPVAPGMVYVGIDGHGLLRAFSAVPYEDQTPAAAVDAEAVFGAAGLDMKTFREAAPRMLPEHAADQLKAWKGPHPKIPDMELTVEIASWKGRITQVQVEFPWYRTADPVAVSRSPWWKLRDAFLKLSLGMAGFFGILLARKNWQKERVDKKGAVRIAIANFAFGMIAWAGLMHPAASDGMFSLLKNIAGESLLYAAMLWVLYLALEPAVRSRWPHAIVTWNRILAGRWQDAQVGAHILIGAAFGTGVWALTNFVLAEPGNTLSSGIALWPLLGARQWVASAVVIAQDGLIVGLVGFFSIFGLRQILKKDWLAAIAASVLFTLGENGILSDPNWEKTVAMYIVLYTGLMFVLLRVGLVATMSVLFFLNALGRVCLGTDLTAWWTANGLATMLLIVGLAGWAFWRSIGSRDVLEERYRN
ncbi:MAG: serine/threonine-protein kinase [Bryobacteraceae bacterium]|jgi:predicted Ser/Thr protein kinase